MTNKKRLLPAAAGIAAALTLALAVASAGCTPAQGAEPTPGIYPPRETEERFPIIEVPQVSPRERKDGTPRQVTGRGPEPSGTPETAAEEIKLPETEPPESTQAKSDAKEAEIPSPPLMLEPKEALYLSETKSGAAFYAPETEAAPETEEPQESEAAPESEASPEAPPARRWTDEEVSLLAMTVWGEARSCPAAEQAAVVWCVLNRVDDPRFPSTISGVITAPWQFSGFQWGNPIEENITALVLDVLARWDAGDGVGRVLPPEYVFFTGDGWKNHFRTGRAGDPEWNWSAWSPYDSPNEAGTGAA